jgi:hypothetical protein
MRPEMGRAKKKTAATEIYVAATNTYESTATGRFIPYKPRRGNRLAAAKALGCHVDTVTHQLASGSGLAFALLERGGAGREAVFDLNRVADLRAAQRCRRAGGTQCLPCRILVETATGLAEHIEKTGHLAGGCHECASPWGLLRPHDRRWLR